MKTGFKVGDCMTMRPITVSMEMSLTDCAKLMKDKKVGSFPVVEKGELVGIVTEEDLVQKAMAAVLDPSKHAVREVAEIELITTSPEKDIYEALKLMRDYGIRQLPVMHDGAMVGFLTIKDILKIQPQLFELLVDKIELREQNRKLAIVEEKEGVCEECQDYSPRLEEVEGRMLCSTCMESG